MMIPLSELIGQHGVKPIGILHVGAHEAQDLESYVAHGVPRVVWIEADPHIYQRLQERIAPFPHHRAFQFAAHERDNEWIDYPDDVRVPTLSLDTFFTEQGLAAEHYNFLNLDARGAELLVLNGSRRCLQNFEYVYADVSGDVGALSSALDSFLKSEGFQQIVARQSTEAAGDALYARNRH